MLKPLSLLLLAAIHGAASAPPAMTRADVMPLRSFDPEDHDFSDLEPLSDLIGDARIVQLAEATHGEGNSVLARSRLTAFLHERMGFDVIVFESPFFEMRDVDLALRRGGTLPESLWNGLYDVWGRAAEIQPLFSLIRASKCASRPIVVTGADSQLYDSNSPSRIHAALVKFLQADPTALTDQDAKAFLGLVDHLRDDNHAEIHAPMFIEGVTLLERIHYLIATPSRRLRTATTPGERHWWVRVIATIKHAWEDKYLSRLAPAFNGSNLDEIASHPMFHAASNRRDRAMAENIEWIVNTAYPGHRVIVWGATSHLQEVGAGWAPGNEDHGPVRVYTTGEHLVGFFGDDLFTVITTAFQGDYASPSTRNSKGEFVWHSWHENAAREGTPEFLLHSLGLEGLIVDARKFPTGLSSPRGVIGGTDTDTPLWKSCDAVLFIDTMQPQTPCTSHGGPPRQSPD